MTWWGASTRWGIALLTVAALCAHAGCGSAAQAEDLYTQGVAAVAREDHAVARERFTRALQMDPALLEAHLNIAALDIREQKAPAALERLESLEKSQIANREDAFALTDPRLQFLKARALIDLDRSAEAEVVLLALAGAGFTDAIYALGMLHFEQEHWAVAREYLQDYRTRAPEGGFSPAAEDLLTSQVQLLVEELTARALEQMPEEQAALSEPVGPMGPPVGPEPIVASPSPEPAVTTPAPVTPEPEPAAQPKPKPKAKPAPKPPAETLSAAERVWRDARFLEIKRKRYAEALAAYREYLRMEPLGEHAEGAQQGIVRCQAELAGVGES